MWQSVSPSFEEFDNFLSQFSVNSFHNEKKVAEYLDFFSLDRLSQQLDADRIETKNTAIERSVSVSEVKPYEPKYDDLCRLHYLVLKRKVLTALEFGSGFSTVFMAEGMRLLKDHFGEWANQNVRVENPFHVYSIEEEQRFLEITRARLENRLSGYVTVERSSVDMILHDNRIATVYSKLPNVSPDFIYLDGPTQFATSSEINGFSFQHKCRMPMSADILRFEFFLEPGSLILVDGRTANSRFLKSYLKRNWNYHHDPIGDVHYFELREEPFGAFNKLKMDFCLGEEWLFE